ncbi:MAG: hypothetical protein RIC95_10190 [Vicingaceae bacterium]
MTIANYIGDNQKRFEELLTLFFADEYGVTQRAALAVSTCFDQDPDRFQPYIQDLVEHLETENLYVAVKRNIVRLLQFRSIPESLQSQLFDRCLVFLADPNEPVAVKAFSMTVLYNICKLHPDLKHEVIPLIEDLLVHSNKSGEQNRGKKILQKLRKL